eukprot:gene26714-4279_t
MRPLQLCPFGRSIEMHSPGTFVVIFIEDGDVEEWKLQKGGDVVAARKSGMMAILDGRDSIFQDDLWKNPMMLKAQETTSVILTLEGNPERNGTTMGSSTAVGSYVASMVDELFNCHMNCWNSAGADQAVHNYLVTIAIKESDTGMDQLPWNSLVLETGIAPAYSCALGRNLHLKHGDVHKYYLDLGSYEFLPPVVHQYDRIGGMPTMMDQFDCYFKI